jgi:hypothetical protein
MPNRKCERPLLLKHGELLACFYGAAFSLVHVLASSKLDYIEFERLRCQWLRRCVAQA